MNIGILTQPLVANYGGLLQNFALQKELEKMGVNPITLDIETHLNTSYIGYLKYVSRFLVKKTFLGATQRCPKYMQKRPKAFDDFVRKYIVTTPKFSRYKQQIIEKNHLDGLIVGSDQVWRPRFNVYPEDMFFSFARETKIKRLSYAASFGVDTWEYSPEMTKRCRELAAQFDAVSVRETSGINLCKENLNVDAVKVLDPTLLHDVTLYNEVCREIPESDEKFVAVYALGLNEKVKQEIELFAQNKGLTTKFFTSDADFTLTVPEWIAKIRDASFVVTDSFHGTAFSIIYNKDFYSIVNKSRGASRFESILSDFGLTGRLVDSTHPIFPKEMEKIDWKIVNEKREELKKMSEGFLSKALLG